MDEEPRLSIFIPSVWEQFEAGLNYLNLDTSIVVNGVKLGDTLSKVNSIFGEPDNENKNGPIVIYQDKNTGKGCIGFWFDDSGNLYSITLIRH